jgi:hypothetical protein
MAVQQGLSQVERLQLQAQAVVLVLARQELLDEVGRCRKPTNPGTSSWRASCFLEGVRPLASTLDWSFQAKSRAV